MYYLRVWIFETVPDDKLGCCSSADSYEISKIRQSKVDIVKMKNLLHRLIITLVAILSNGNHLYASQYFGLPIGVGSSDGYSGFYAGLAYGHYALDSEDKRRSWSVEVQSGQLKPDGEEGFRRSDFLLILSSYQAVSPVFDLVLGVYGRQETIEYLDDVGEFSFNRQDFGLSLAVSTDYQITSNIHLAMDWLSFLMPLNSWYLNYEYSVKSKVSADAEQEFRGVIDNPDFATRVTVMSPRGSYVF